MPAKTIFNMINCLNNPNEQGGYFLPHIQRPFVWNTFQIEQLFDSILRLYPFGSLLFFKTIEDIRHRKFIDNYLNTLNHDAYFLPRNNELKTLVLDGQQRLQALFIGLNGSYEGKELYFNILSGGPGDFIENKYIFKFLGEPRFPFIKFKDIIYTGNRLLREVADGIVQYANIDLDQGERDLITDNIDRVRQEFIIKQRINFE